MILKKIIITIFFVCLLSGCAQNAALLGPAYTLANTGNIYQAGLTYSSDLVVTKATGKTTSQNLRS